MSSTSTAVLPADREWLAHLRREASRFVEVAARSPLQVHVPSYPAFTVETLSAHIGRVLRAFQATVSAGSSPQDQVIQAPAGQAIVGWVQAGLEPLLTSLSQAPPDQPVAFPHDAGDRPAALIAHCSPSRSACTAGTWSPSSASTMRSLRTSRPGRWTA